MSKVEIEIPDDRWFRGEWEIRPQDKVLSDAHGIFHLPEIKRKKQ